MSESVSVDTGGSSTPVTAESALASAASAAATSAASPDAGTPGPSGAGIGTPTGTTAATGQAPAQTPAAPAQAAPGPIPFDAHQRALANARAKAAAEAQRQYEWAKDLNQERVKQALMVADMLESDPRGLYSRLSQELAGMEDTMPDPDYEANNGAKFYSADSLKKALQVMSNQLRREFQGAVQPLTEARQQQLAAEQQAQQQAAQRAQFRQALETAQSMPLFKDNEKAISEVMSQIPREDVEQNGLVWALNTAYMTFLRDNWATLQVQTEQSVRDGLKRAATAAGGNVTPGGAQPTPPAQPLRTERDLARYMEQKFQEQGG